LVRYSSLFNDDRNLENEFINPIKKLKNIIDLYPNLNDYDTKVLQGNGCSYADKLKEQSLFINDVLVAHASDCLSNLLCNKEITMHGGFANLQNGMVNPIRV